jgi:hypothetical protein
MLVGNELDGHTFETDGLVVIGLELDGDEIPLVAQSLRAAASAFRLMPVASSDYGERNARERAARQGEMIAEAIYSEARRIHDAREQTRRPPRRRRTA